jgi:flavodoxin
MKALIVYDSTYGNTEKIAKSIGSAITGDVKVLRVSELSPSGLKPVDFLIIGSPTYGGRPTPAVQGFLNNIPESSVKGMSVAAFDTRVSAKWVKIFGYASGKIAGRLKAKGGTLIMSPEGFFVKSAKGPLIEGELERAASWAKEIIQSKKYSNF